jgi:hypothetical protein
VDFALWTPGGVVIAIIAAGASVIGAVLAFRTSGRDSKQKLNEYIDGRVEQKLKEADLQIDEMRNKLFAAGRVFQAIALQSAPDFHPNITPTDIQILEDTIPAVWRTKRSA